MSFSGKSDYWSAIFQWRQALGNSCLGLQMDGSIVNSCVMSHYSNFPWQIRFTSAKNQWDAHAFCVQKTIATIFFIINIQGLRKKEEKQSRFADRFPCEATTVMFLPEEDHTEHGGIIDIRVATHTKPARGWAPSCSTHLCTTPEQKRLGLQFFN